MKKLFLFLVLLNLTLFAQDSYYLSILLMRSTFKIYGNYQNGKYRKIGTAFFVGKPIKTDSAMANRILVTAAHVLSDIEDDFAYIDFRKKEQDQFILEKRPIQIREEGKPLWVKHPTEDVAAMYLGIPDEYDFDLLNMDFLATDDQLKNIEIRPGDQLFALGYPFGQSSNESGFPILRSGTLASYPILPTNKTKTFLFDFEVFPGNSGGPVFIFDFARAYKSYIVGVAQHIMGIVTKEKNFEEFVSSQFESSMKKHPLKIAVVVHASLIKETIELLPDLK